MLIMKEIAFVFGLGTYVVYFIPVLCRRKSKKNPQGPINAFFNEGTYTYQTLFNFEIYYPSIFPPPHSHYVYALMRNCKNYSLLDLVLFFHQ